MRTILLSANFQCTLKLFSVSAKCGGHIRRLYPLCYGSDTPPFIPFSKLGNVERSDSETEYKYIH